MELYPRSLTDVPGRVSNIQVEVNKERITLQWDAPPSNGADITSYAVTVFQDGQQVYSMMSQTTSVSVTRSQLQEEGAAIRTENTEYLVRIVAENEVGQGEEGSETFVLPAGMIESSICMLYEYYTLCSKNYDLFLVFFPMCRVCSPSRM